MARPYAAAMKNAVRAVGPVPAYAGPQASGVTPRATTCATAPVLKPASTTAPLVCPVTPKARRALYRCWPPRPLHASPALHDVIVRASVGVSWIASLQQLPPVAAAMRHTRRLTPLPSAVPLLPRATTSAGQERATVCPKRPVVEAGTTCSVMAVVARRSIGTRGGTGPYATRVRVVGILPSVPRTPFGAVALLS